jgi:hypothetical protein
VVGGINVGAGLAAHGHTHQVEAVAFNSGVLLQVRNRVTGVNLRLRGYGMREVYDTNYLHKKKLLPVGQDGNSIPISVAKKP